MTTSFSQYFDHTLLKPTATTHDILQLCQEAQTHHFFSVCVNPYWIPLCVDSLRESSVEVCTVVGFPLGANTITTKLRETEEALTLGATEIDVVINIGALKEQQHKYVKQELMSVVDICKNHALVKVIVESGVLNPEELSWAIDAVNESGAEFIKTSTGFAAVGARPESVAQMKNLGRPGLKIKASGGIRTAQDFLQYVELGVHRVGASQSVSILKDLGV